MAKLQLHQLALRLHHVTSLHKRQPLTVHQVSGKQGGRAAAAFGAMHQDGAAGSGFPLHPLHSTVNRVAIRRGYIRHAVTHMVNVMLRVKRFVVGALGAYVDDSVDAMVDGAGKEISN